MNVSRLHLLVIPRRRLHHHVISTRSAPRRTTPMSFRSTARNLGMRGPASDQAFEILRRKLLRMTREVVLGTPGDGVLRMTGEKAVFKMKNEEALRTIGEESLE